MQPTPAVNKDTPIRYDIECLMKLKAKAVSVFGQGQVLYYTASITQIPPILTFFCIYFTFGSHTPFSFFPSFFPFSFLFYNLYPFISLFLILSLSPSPSALFLSSFYHFFFFSMLFIASL